MVNEDIVKDFFRHYHLHEFEKMHKCLDENVTFSDFAFDNIQGKAVKAMWHWFCVAYEDRKEPIEVREFDDVPKEFCKIVQSEGDIVVAKYRVRYLYGKEEKKRLVDYCINAHFRIQNNKIVDQKDSFSSISQFEFAKMLLGPPWQLLALTPLFRYRVKKKAAEKLSRFMKEYKYEGA